MKKEKQTEHELIEIYNNLKKQLKDIKLDDENTPSIDTIIIGSNSYDLNDLNLEELIQLSAQIRMRKNNYYKEVDEIGLTEVPLFKIQGYPVDDIIKSLHTRCRVLTNSSKINELESAIKDLEALFSREDKVKATLANISSKFNLNRQLSN